MQKFPWFFLCLFFFSCQGTPTTIDGAGQHDAQPTDLGTKGDTATDIADATLGDARCNLVCDTPPDDCHETVGVCVDGGCKYPLKAAGAGCDDGNDCTLSDVCDAVGSCTGTPSCGPVISAAVATPHLIRASQEVDVLLTAQVASQDGPIASVVVSLVEIGSGAAEPMYDDGTHGDKQANDGLFSLETHLSAWSVNASAYSLDVTATDSDGLTGSATILFTVQPPNPVWRKVSADTPGKRNGSRAIYDSSNQRVILFGGYVQKIVDGLYPTTEIYNDVWSWSVADGWKKLSPSGTPPVARSYGAMIYDDAAERMILFGGWDGTDSLDDVWALSLTAGQESWQKLQPAGTPPSPRDGAAAAYDSAHDRMIIFGGWEQSLANELWTLDLTVGSEAWTEVSGVGSAPYSYGEARLAYDTTNDRAVLFGAYDVDGEIPQLWSLDLQAANNEIWTAIDAIGPEDRWDSTFLYDLAKGRFILIGGQWHDDIWSLSSGLGSEAWTNLKPQSDPSKNFSDLAAAFLPAPDGRLWVSEDSHAIWLVDLDAKGTSWVRDRPQPRAAASLGISSGKTELLMYGGAGELRLVGSYYSDALDDFWSYDLAGTSPWVRLGTPSNGPTPRRKYHGGFLFDPIQQEFIVSGGLDSTHQKLTDCWRLSVIPGAEKWAAVPIGLATSPYNLSVIDTNNNRALFLSDKVALDLATETWTSLTTSGSAPSLYNGTVGYDAVSERVIYVDTTGDFEVWAMDTRTPGAESWTRIYPGGPKPQIPNQSVAIIHQSAGKNAMYGYSSYLWRLDLTAGNERWSNLHVNGAPPALRRSPGIVHDAERNRILLFGGEDIYDYDGAEPGPPGPWVGFDDIWEVAYLEDNAPAATPKCVCSTASASDYRVGYLGGSYLIGGLSYGSKMTSGTYTIEAHPDGSVNLKRNGVVVASTSYDPLSPISPNRLTTITFDYYLSLKVVLEYFRGYLQDLPDLFNDTAQLVVSCTGCAP